MGLADAPRMAKQVAKNAFAWPIGFDEAVVWFNEVKRAVRYEAN